MIGTDDVAQLLRIEPRRQCRGTDEVGEHDRELAAFGSRSLGAGAVGLPESPRRREWRRARLAAAQELPRFRSRLAQALAEAERMLAAGPRGATSSAAWLALGRRLEGDCRRLGSAWHCLHEWPEPDEDAPAPAPGETARLGALRNVRLWREPD